MTLRKDSLGIQNSRGRPSGPSESLGLSANFKKLRALDRKITELDKIISLRSCGNFSFKNNVLVQKELKIYNCCVCGKTELMRLIERRIKLDLKRKEIRNKRKYWNKNNGK